MKKILYLMHIEWDWIKQRPHFIAENLSKYNEVQIFYLSSMFKKVNNHKTPKNKLNIHPLYRLPYSYKKGIYFLNKIYIKLFLYLILKKFNPDYIWITFPTLYDYLPSNKYKIIYDCMDDAISALFSNFYHDKIIISEKKLVNSAYLIFVSAVNLALILNERYDRKENIILVRNAFDGHIISTKEIEIKDKNNNYKIGYIGTVDEWFDFELLEYTLKEIENIEYHILGPVNPKVEKNNSNKRIKFHGPIAHEQLYSYSQKFDCLIMPFKLKELIYSVDPVKLYEYINYNKPIISIFYKEIDRFSPYVHFYTNKGELMLLLHDLVNEKLVKKYSNKERINFLKNNSWNKRSSEIMKYL